MKCHGSPTAFISKACEFVVIIKDLIIAGDCVLIHGSVIHKSGRNTTQAARTVYTYHMVEKGAAWSPLNWTQPTEKLPYPSIYSN
ncbi:hypothetical protein AVEN_205893-1 [Araneus ventricosus]|uniref:Phytanoyl-CoA dioxygenase domain-containing protein 1 n=2 Tax=Araneus ventricosus TaxID=182803 RepID=A0A4Y1ZLA5_ARAVE|nr:hypothetical protein AVEN_256751-1 [Araneus ventricosus]GBL56348.1 hypothetical protein AVEN_205893-1 [Araneus ventricosus]